uniref:Putative reverse transcriptase domain-containing protein n=1 Tax=Tanacetum cinerariifolium TaxID=118510 RepID=A0A6L2JA39_TANCI|nr:putative reverse transcriptase domain-containing protein [Tanacetum cinerariifolium]
MSKEEHESHLKMNLELLNKKKCHVKPNKVLMVGDVRTLIMEEAHAMKYYVRPGVSLRKPKIVKRVKLIVEMKLLEFSVSDHVMMKVLPWKGVVRFGKKGELVPRLFARLIEEFRFALHRGEFTLSSLDVLQGFSFFLQMGLTLILATLDGLNVGLLGDVIGKDDCDDDD